MLIVTTQGQQFLARLRIPHLRRLVVAPRSQPLPLRTPGNAVDMLIVATQGQQFLAEPKFLARLDIPHLRRFVVAPRSQPPPLRTPSNAEDRMIAVTRYEDTGFQAIPFVCV